MKPKNSTENFVSTILGMDIPDSKKFSEIKQFGMTEAASSFGRPLISEHLVMVPLAEIEGSKRSLYASRVIKDGKWVYNVSIKYTKIYN